MLSQKVLSTTGSRTSNLTSSPLFQGVTSVVHIQSSGIRAHSITRWCLCCRVNQTSEVLAAIILLLSIMMSTTLSFQNVGSANAAQERRTNRKLRSLRLRGFSSNSLPKDKEVSRRLRTHNPAPAPATARKHPPSRRKRVQCHSKTPGGT